MPSFENDHRITQVNAAEWAKVRIELVLSTAGVRSASFHYPIAQALRRETLRREKPASLLRYIIAWKLCATCGKATSPTRCS